MIGKISKTIRIERILLRMNFERILEYRTNAIFLFVGSALYNIGAILFINFLFSKIINISGWDKWDLIFLYGIGQIFAYLFFFSTYYNFKGFSRLIRRGDLDFILAKPVNSLIYTTLNSFSFEFLIGLIQPAIIIAYALMSKAYSINLLGIVIAAFSLLVSLIIVHLLQVITIIPTFFTIENQYHRFFSETSDLINYPYEIYDNKITKFLFFIIIPYALLINIPFRAVIGELDTKMFFLQIFVCIGFSIVSSFLWQVGLKHYNSASS